MGLQGFSVGQPFCVHYRSDAGIGAKSLRWRLAKCFGAREQLSRVLCAYD